jgi:hypothetical protein
MGLSAAASLCLTGCVSGVTDLDDEELGEAADAIINLNSLDLASMNLRSTRLSPLNPAMLPADAKAAIEDPGKQGVEARKALRYIVECAQPAGTSFDFAWTDGGGAAHLESYPGRIGLAPGWMHAPATQDDLAWVSACLVSKANRYGAVVEISSRGSGGALAAYDMAEYATFVHLEGAFWGDLFASLPVAYACTNPPEQPYALSKQRECASGIPAPPGTEDGCGDTKMVGDCAVQCTSFEPLLGYYSGCFEAPGDPESSHVVTVYLD